MTEATLCAGEQLHLLSGLGLLRDLTLKGCYRVADQGLACLGCLTHLHRLNLQGCWQITVTGLGHLSGEELQTLAASDMNRVIVAAVMSVS